MEKWKCKKCNYIFVGDEAPRICPNCGHKAEFEPFFELESGGPFLPLYDE